MNIITTIFRVINNILLAFCSKCLTCHWKKTKGNMFTPDRCYGCSLEHGPRKYDAKRVTV